MTVFNGLLGVMLFNAMWAVYTTFKKEKIMIEGGEGSLPTEAYVYIIIRNVTRMILMYAMKFIPYVVSLISTVSGFNVFILFFAMALVVEVLSAVIETLIRVISIKMKMNKINKESEKAFDELDEQ